MIINPYRFASVTPPPGPPVTDGLVLWMDASDLAVADGASIDAWPDKSPVGTVTTPGDNKPVMRLTGFSGKPGADVRIGDGGGFYYAAIDWTGSAGGTLLAAFLNQTTGLIPMGLGFGPSGGANTCWIPFSGDQMYDANLSSARANTNISSRVAELASPSSYVVTSGAAGGMVRLNRVDTLPNSNPFATPESYGGLGQLVGQSGGDRRITAQTFAEVLAFNRVLDSTEIGLMEDYFTDKWGTP